jgi:hypothetical protein
MEPVESPCDQHIVLEEQCTAEEHPACVAVLAHMYTHRLPETDVELLCKVCFMSCLLLHFAFCRTISALLKSQMAQKADIWDCAMTVRACGARLRALAGTTDSAADLTWLFVKLPEALRTKLELGADVEVAALTRLFGRVREVIITDSVREQFSRLPFPLVLRWAGLDELVVDSEDSVVVLLTVWHRQQSNAKPTDAQCTALCGCVRVAHISASYIMQVCVSV